MNTQVQKICAEIERRMETAIAISEDPETRENELAQTLFEGKAMAYKDMLRYLDALEASENIGHLEGLDEAAEESMRSAIERFYDVVGKPRALVNEREVSDFAEELFKAGAEWMAGQGYTFETIMQEDDVDELVPTCPDMYNHGYSYDDKVIVQIRKKQ